MQIERGIPPKRDPPRGRRARFEREKPGPDRASFVSRPRQVRVDRRSYVAHPTLEPEIEQQPPKGIRGCGVFPDVEGLSTGSFGLSHLAPNRQLGSSADDDRLSLGRVSTYVAGELGEDVPIPACIGRAAINPTDGSGRLPVADPDEP